MTKEEIMNTYAIEQGYESFNEMILDLERDYIIDHINAVTDLIQEELLNKVAENVKNLLESEKVGEIFIEDYQLILKSILSTKNIK